MFLLKIFRPKNLLKLVWFSFGAFGLYTVVKQAYPNFPGNMNRSALVKGIQGSLLPNEAPEADFTSQPLNLASLKGLDPQAAGQVISQAIKQEIIKIMESTTTEIKQFPAKQVRKIKIGACEELLEEDICNVAKEINCQ